MSTTRIDSRRAALGFFTGAVKQEGKPSDVDVSLYRVVGPVIDRPQVEDSLRSAKGVFDMNCDPKSR